MSSQKSTAMMSAPSRARTSAWLRPWPRAAPVMRATFPATRPDMNGLLRPCGRVLHNVIMLTVLYNTVCAKVDASVQRGGRVGGGPQVFLPGVHQPLLDRCRGGRRHRDQS